MTAVFSSLACQLPQLTRFYIGEFEPPSEIICKAFRDASLATFNCRDRRDRTTEVLGLICHDQASACPVSSARNPKRNESFAHGESPYS
jgi:hypothetical protein